MNANQKTYPRSELLKQIKALLPQGRKGELIKALNIKYGSVAELKVKLEEVKKINFNEVEKPVKEPVNIEILDEIKKIVGIEVELDWVRKKSLPDEILDKEPEPILSTASSLEKKNYNRRYNYWLKNVVINWLENQPIRYGKKLLSGKERILEPLPINNETYRFGVNEGNLTATLEAFKKKFINRYNGENYCLIIKFKYSKTEDIINRSFKDVPLKYTEKKLNFFNRDGNVIVDNDDKMDGLCIPRLIQKEIFQKKSLDKIIDDMEEAFLNNSSSIVIFEEEEKPVKEPVNIEILDEIIDDMEEAFLNPLDYKPSIDVKKNGITLRQLEPYCEKFRIQAKVFDIDETLLYQFKPKKIDKNKTILMFIIHDGHPYSIIDKVRRLELSQKNINVLTRLEIINKEKPEEELNEDEYTHRKYIADAPYDFDNIIGDLYTDDYEDLRDLFIWLYLKQGKIPRYKNDGENITKILINPNCSLIYNSEYDIYKNLDNFNNDTSSKIAFNYFKELEIESKLNINNLKSTFNKNTLDFCNLTHSYATTKQFKSVNDISKCIQYDINKQYSSIMETKNMGWLVMSNKEDVKEYKGQNIFDNCLYYVEPSEFNPLIYSYGVYYGKIVKMAIDDNLIKKSDIKYYLNCDVKKSDVFSKFVNDIYEKYGDVGKNIVNHYIGSLGRRNKTWSGH
jgi:hypothetical protein